MTNRSERSNWLGYLVETLTLSLVIGVLCGFIIGLVRGWKYFQKGFPLISLDTLNSGIIESAFIVSIFLLLYLFCFLVFRNLFKNAKWSSFIASALALLPFILFWAYEINKSNYVYWSTLFEWKSITLNLKIGLGFLFLWLLISTGLFLWTRLRLLKTEAVNVKPLASLLAVIVIFNISIYLFNNFSKTVDGSPNVIILLVDCLRADHLGSYGYGRNTTPNIDQFSKDAVTFTQAISQATFTKMSIASLFTSLYAYQHGIYRGAGELMDVQTGTVTTDVLGAEETTLAEVLFQNGFLTAAWLQQGQLSSYTGFDQGFIDYNERQGDIESINNKFLKWARKVGKNHKFFAYIHYLDLHSPYQPKSPYDTLYLSGNQNEGEKSKKEKRIFIQKALYDGQLTYIDSQIGHLLNELKKAGLYDNTLIIITADHGDAFGEHGFFTHSQAPYEELVRVPLIIKFPKSLHAGEVIKNQVRLIDVMPTIIDYLNLETGLKLSGFSLLNYLDNNRALNREVDFPEYAVTEIYNQRHNLDVISIRTEEFKYIHFKNKDDELYDLKADPSEKNNIIKQKPEVAQRFSQMLPPILAQRNEKRVNKVTLDKGTVEELKALGYIQ